MSGSLCTGLFAALLPWVGCGGASVPATDLASSEATVAPPRAGPVIPASLLCTEAQAAEGTIGKVVIEGQGVPVALCAFLGSRAGEPLSDARVDADVRALWADGRVDDVVAFRESEGSTLVFSVRMRPTVGAFTIRGADAPGVPEEVRFEGPTRLNLASLRGQTARAERALRDAGWRTAKVGHTVTPLAGDADGKVDVVVQVETGPRAIVQTVQLVGPPAARVVELLTLLRTSQGEPFDAPALERDVLVIQADGYDRGRVLTKVDPPQVEEVDGGKGVRVTLRVDEGPVFHLGKVRFEGDLIGTPKSYEKDLWSSAPNAIFSRSVIASDLERVRAFHASHHSTVEVTPETAIDSDRGLVDIVVRVTKQR